MDLEHLSDGALLRLHCNLMAALRQRGVVRSSNNPVADYAETIVAKALGASLQNNSKAGFDAVGADGTRYQIKARRLTPQNRSTQLSAIRNLASHPFDALAAVMFDKDLQVLYAASIPVSIVQQLGRYRAHTNAHVVHFSQSVMDIDGVDDITDKVRIASAKV